MLKGYLTASLLNTFVSQYDIMPMLRRDEKETNQAMLDGIEFEKNAIEGKIPELIEVVNGGLYQEPLYKVMGDYVLFGFADLIKQFMIYDFKFVKSYEWGKYRNAVQHLQYMYCADIDNFRYIIGTKDGNIYYEDYMRNDEELEKIVNQFDRWLDLTNNREIYSKNYSLERLKEKYDVNFI